MGRPAPRVVSGLPVAALRRHEAFVPVLIALGWLVMCAGTVPWGDFPLNDDWTYGLAVRSILEHGRFELVAQSSANVFLQAYWGALFCKVLGFSYEALRLSTVVAGEVGLMASYALLREVGSTRAVAALGTLTIGCNPLYLSQSLTFMTDVPFSALIFLSLWLYVRGAKRDRDGLIAAAFGVAVAAVLIRQFAVALPVAFAAGELWRRRPTVRRSLVLAGAVALSAAVHLGFQQWMIATGRTEDFATPVHEMLHFDRSAVGWHLRSNMLAVTGLLGLCAAPFAILLPGGTGTSGSSRSRRLMWACVMLAEAGAVGFALWRKVMVPPLLGNVIAPWGIGPLTLSDTFAEQIHLPVMAGAGLFWPGVTVLACWSSAVLLAAGVSASIRAVRGDWLRMALCVWVTGYLAAILALGMTTSIFDRYALPISLPLMTLIVLWCPAGRVRGRVELWAGAAVIGVMGLYSLLGTHDWLAWHRARHTAEELLAARSVTANSVDGGYEYNGLHTYHRRAAERHETKGWWVDDNRYQIAAGPAPGFRILAVFPVATWLWAGADVMLLERE